jgi:hypothetical protein
LLRRRFQATGNSFYLIFITKFFSFSEASHKTGLNTATTARIFKKLMTDRLKLKKFIGQGGDWGMF